MTQKVIELLKKYDMLNPCDFVVAGVSGGADSLALLHFLKFGLKEYRLNLQACHLNHMLRGEESLRDQHHVEQLCREWDIPLRVEQVDVANIARTEKMTLEETGRQARYRLFQQLAGERGKIATAHTLSDRYETMLFHLTRGTGLKGLCAIPPKRENIIRPLLSITREEVEAYCSEHHIPYMTDSTNLNPEYSRNKIRLEVIPRLQEINPNAVEQAGRTLSLLEQDSAYLERFAAEELEACREGDGLSIQKLSGEPAIRNRVLRQWLAEQHVTTDYDTLERIVNLSQNGKLNISGNRFCVITDGVLRLTEEGESQLYFAFPLTEAQMVEMPSGATYSFLWAEKEKLNSIQEIFKNSTYKYIDSQKIVGKLMIRQRQTGDQICIFPRKITKSIKKLFNEAKIPIEMREKLFVICDECGIIYVENFGFDQRVAPSAESESYLVICKQEDYPNIDGKDSCGWNKTY